MLERNGKLGRTLPATVLFLVASASPVLAQSREQPAPSPFASCLCQDIMNPTQVANAFWDELAAAGDRTAAEDPSPGGAPSTTGEQVPIVSKYLRLVTIEFDEMPTDRLHRLALGEGAFLTFQVQLAHDYFASLLDGSDPVASHAWDRLMQVRHRALGRVVEARTMVDRFYDRFPPTELNYRGRTQQIVNFADRFVQEGSPEEAVALIEEEIRALPTNSPYQSYTLLPRYAEQISMSPRRSEIRRLAEERLVGLRELDEEWRGEVHPAADDPVLRGDMPAWYWRSQGIRRGESLRAGRHRQLGTVISLIEEWLDGLPDEGGEP